ncbi:MAG: helix-turn-helix domain-containing protein [Myxococcaceae bacterium]
MTERAQKILIWLRSQETSEISIRQATLAEHFNCSRRTIGRCLKELKEAGLLTDLNKRHENRCKIYKIQIPAIPLLQREEIEEALSPAAQHQLKLYGRTFREMFRIFDGRSGRPTFESCFTQIAGGLRELTDEEELYHKIFAGFWALPSLKETDKSWRSEPENRNAGGTCYS